MSAPNDVLTGDQLLTAVSDAIVAFRERYFDRGPVIAKALLLGEELLACVLAEVFSDVEKAIINLQGGTVLQEDRSPFQEEMQHRFIAAVEHLSGRGVQAFISNSHVDPDVEIELFMLKPTRDSIGARRVASTTACEATRTRGNAPLPTDQPLRNEPCMLLVRTRARFLGRLTLPLPRRA